MYSNILVVTTGKGVQLISVNSKARGLNAVSQQAVELSGEGTNSGQIITPSHDLTPKGKMALIELKDL